MKKINSIFVLCMLVTYTASTQNGINFCFSPTSNYYIPGVDPYSITNSDFNGDGKIDLATANGNILLGNGSGSFSMATIFTPTPALTPSIISADFNADGKMDLANLNGSNGRVFLGNGLGSFSLATTFTAGTTPWEITSADFNGDNKLDLAIANFSSHNVSILLGNGLGGFSSATNFTVGTNPRSVTSKDFNGDGKLDLATANDGTNNVSVLLGNGIGGFSAATNFAVGQDPNSVRSADLNGDGKLDLATANLGSNNVSILLGNGVGGFSAATNFTVDAAPISIITVDINGDGLMDLATANCSALSSNVSILIGNGLGNFTVGNTWGVGSDPRSVTSADFNGDGTMDLAVAKNYNEDVGVLLGIDFNVSTSQNNVSCNLGSNGSATAIVGSGPSPYSYSWNTSPMQNTASATNLTAGSYTVTVLGSYGCKRTASVTITQPSAISITTITTGITCYGGNDGTATASASGGSSPYSYTWNTSPVQSSATATNLAAGNHIVNVTDSKGCNKTATATLVNPVQTLTVNIGSNSPICLYGDINLTSSATGGTGPYTYFWNDNYLYTSTLQNPSLIGVASYPTGGFIYTVTVTDSQGCKNSKSLPVTFFNWNVNLNITNPTSCSNPCNGSVSSSVISGGHSPYKYTWSNGVTGPSQISGVCAGDYTLTIANTDGTCPKSYTTEIEPPVSFNNEVKMINLACVSQTNVPTAFAAYYLFDLPTTLSPPPSNPENYVDPGKKVRFKVLCKNQKSNGQSIVTGICKVRCNSPYATLTDSIAALNNVAWNTQAWSADEFELQLANNLPEGTVIYLDFIVIENTFQYKTGCVPIPVTPLVYSSNNPNTVDDDNNPDSQGNGDGIVNPNETIEFYPWLNNVAPFSADYTYGHFRNLDNLSYVNIWNNLPGVNTTVYDNSWWNYGFGQPQQIPLGAQDMMPEFDFVFDYTNSTTVNNFKLYMVMAGGFNLFSSSALSLVQWTLPYTFNNTAVSLNEIENNKFVKIYPNPAANYITIEIEADSDETNLTLLDIMGKQIEKKVLKGSFTKCDFKTSELSNGIYFLNIQSGDKRVTKKINIIR